MQVRSHWRKELEKCMSRGVDGIRNFMTFMKDPASGQKDISGRKSVTAASMNLKALAEIRALEVANLVLVME